MPLLNFKPQFVEPIRSGRKHHTIRATRSIPIKPGDNLYLYVGLRHKGAQRILPEPVKCSIVQLILINKDSCCDQHFLVNIEGVDLCQDECETLARADGFGNFTQMMEFWEGRLPFVGQIIHWKLTTDN